MRKIAASWFGKHQGDNRMLRMAPHPLEVTGFSSSLSAFHEGEYRSIKTKPLLFLSHVWSAALSKTIRVVTVK